MERPPAVVVSSVPSTEAQIPACVSAAPTIVLYLKTSEQPASHLPQATSSPKPWCHSDTKHANVTYTMAT